MLPDQSELRIRQGCSIKRFKLLEIIKTFRMSRETRPRWQHEPGHVDVSRRLEDSRQGTGDESKSVLFWSTEAHFHLHFCEMIQIDYERKHLVKDVQRISKSLWYEAIMF